MLSIYTERKKKRNTKFDIEYQNNKWIYFHNFFHQIKVMIWLMIILSHNAVPHAKSEENPLSKVCIFLKIS